MHVIKTNVSVFRHAFIANYVEQVLVAAENLAANPSIWIAPSKIDVSSSSVANLKRFVTFITELRDLPFISTKKNVAIARRI